MSGIKRRARIVEVFPMRLGSEILVDVTVEPEGEVSPPAPDQTIVLCTPGGEVEVPVWAVPRIQHPEGCRRLNVQFRREDLGGVMPVEGLEISW